MPEATPIETKLIGHLEAARPRIALLGLRDEEIESIAALGGTLRAADDVAAYLEHWTWTETDLVISKRSLLSTPSHVHVLFWGGAKDQVGLILLVERATNKARQLMRSADLFGFEDAMDQLVARADQLDQGFKGLTPWNTRLSTLLASTDYPVVALYPRDSGHDVGTARMDPEVGVGLAIPAEAELVPWLRGFLRFLGKFDSASVPDPPPLVTTSAEWSTPTELRIEHRIEQARAEAQRLEKEAGDLEDRLAAEREAGDANQRAVLWLDGNALENAVATLLGELGFEVEHVDDTLSAGEPRREDFAIRTPDRDGWVAIGEVKGYKRGARANDAAKVNKHVKTFIRETSREPDRIWWFINEFRLRNPDERPGTLSGHEGQLIDLDTVAIPTTALYQLWLQVALGNLGAAEAREALISALPGVYTNSEVPT